MHTRKQKETLLLSPQPWLDRPVKSTQAFEEDVNSGHLDAQATG